MKVLHFGAGSIGKGFIGKLLSDSGMQVIFADINNDVINQLNQYQKYLVNIVGKEQHQQYVKNISAIHSSSPKVIDLINQVNLITTSVGSLILPKIAPTIAKGLQERIKTKNNIPLNIIACENMINASSTLKGYVYTYLKSEEQIWADQYVGFVDSAIDRLVPPIQNQLNTYSIVDVEPFYEWIVNQTQFIGNKPKLIGIKYVNDLIPYIERKLFTVNTGHAITAYLGLYYGHLTIEGAIKDPKIRSIVYGAMQESGQVLIQRYQFNPLEHEKYIQNIISRFENPFLKDDTERVARQPIRKLGYKERLVKPLLGTLEYGLKNDNLLIGISAALAYQNPHEQDTKIIHDMIEDIGFSATVINITSIENQPSLIDKIYIHYNNMINNVF